MFSLYIYRSGVYQYYKKALKCITLDAVYTYTVMYCHKLDECLTLLASGATLPVVLGV